MMGHKLLFIVAAASLVLSGGTGWAQDDKDCRGKNDHPSIRGQWTDNELGLAVTVETNADAQQNTEGRTVPATGTYVIPQTCKRPRLNGAIVKFDNAFDGIFTFPTLVGTISVCHFKSDKDHPSGYTTSFDKADLRLTMSEDGMTLSGDYRASGADTQHVTYTRATKPQYYFKKWTTVSIPGGTKIYNKPEPGSDVNLTVSEPVDFQIVSTILDKDGYPTWYSVTRAGHPIGVDYGWVKAGQVKCKKAPPAAVGRIGPPSLESVEALIR